MTARTSMLHVRIEDDTKEQATAALDAMGLSVSDAVRLFLKRVVADQAFSLELKVPNAQTRAAMAEADEIAARNAARFATADESMADLKKAGGSQARLARHPRFKNTPHPAAARPPSPTRGEDDDCTMVAANR